MQISPFQSLKSTSFKGSFNVNINDFVPDCDNYERRKRIAPVEVTQKVNNFVKKSPYAKLMTIFRDGQKTDVRMFESKCADFPRYLPDNIKRLCDFHRIHPENDLFMVGGKDKENKPFIIFNTFFWDDKTNINYEQLYCLKSHNEELTQPQKSVIQIFSDRFNTRYFMLSSNKNPLKDMGFKKDGDDSFLLDITLDNMAYLSKKTDLNDALDKKGHINPIVYSANSQYIRYKVIPLEVFKNAIFRYKNC